MRGSNVEADPERSRSNPGTAETIATGTERLSGLGRRFSIYSAPNQLCFSMSFALKKFIG
jgi:hypothetical protein